MSLAIISTMISSLALAAVALSLLLQARQLRTNQLQVSRTAQLELMKIALDNPSMAAEALGISDPETYVKEVFINWHFVHFFMAYEVGQISETTLRSALRSLFQNEHPYKWWSWSRKDWQEGNKSRREQK